MTAPPLNAWTGLAGGGAREFPVNDPNVAEIAGYMGRLSYAGGNQASLFVHTTAAQYSVRVVRDGATPRQVWARDGIPGRRQSTPEAAHAVGCGWQQPELIPIDTAWPTGAYLVLLRAEGSAGPCESEALFYVAPAPGPREGRIAFIQTTATATAYNDWGGANAYRSIVDGRSTDVPAPRLSLDRPWARGFVRLPRDAPRHGDTPDLPLHTPQRFPCLEWALARGVSRHYCDAGWAHYERPFACWAEQQGYALDYLTQHDLHDNPDCLDGYAAAVIVGHDEYSSWEMRDTIEAFTRRGGQIARFAGNYIWQIRLESAGRVQVCHKLSTLDPITVTQPRRATTSWDSACVGRPGAATFGLTGLGGIYVRMGAAAPRAPGGFTLYRPDHWAFAGTDLYYADVFGAAPARILAYEVDGVDYTFRDGLPYPTSRDGAPASLEILAMSPAVRGERNRHGTLMNAPLDDVRHALAYEPLAYNLPDSAIERGAAMMATMTAGKGTVFNAGCCNWVSGLIHGDPTIEQITRNVLDRFLRPA